VHKDYSATPLPKKLGIKDASRVALAKAPEGFAEELGVKVRLRGEFDVAVLFAKRQGELTRAFAPLARRLAPAGGLWVAWPKKSSAWRRTSPSTWCSGPASTPGSSTTKSCAIDDTWQAVRFVIRLRDR
jgi:hypothetical protein